jgi:prevent-host-death family protein
MATMINITEAKAQVSKLVDRAAAGEDIIIARNGIPVARLASLKPEKRQLRPGLLKGRIWIADDFDAPLPEEIQKYFEGPE